MKSAFRYRPRFVDIRVRPPAPEPTEARVDERVCDYAGCRAAATARAPKSNTLLDEHYWFCQAHAAEYNRNWNFFDGMSEGEARARMVDEATTGGRPTWSTKAGPRMREQAQRGVFRDRFGFFGGRREPGRENPEERRLGRLERGALADLDLEAGAQPAAIRHRYIELVKRCHPDANGGDRSAEQRLGRVIRAYKTLRKAKLA